MPTGPGRDPLIVMPRAGPDHPPSRPGAAPPLPRRAAAPASCAARLGAFRIPGRLARRSARAPPPAPRGSGALGLGRLDHQCLVDDQREVDRRRVEPLLQQPLGHVQRRARRGPSSASSRPTARTSCMQGRSKADGVGVGEPPAQPVRVEHGPLRRPAAARRHRAAGCRRARGQHQRVAVPGVHPTDRPGGVDPAERVRPRSGEPDAAPAGTRSSRSATATGPGARALPRRGGSRRSCAGSCARCRSPCRPGARRPGSALRLAPS